MAASLISQMQLGIAAAATSPSIPPGVPQFALDYAPLVYLYSDDPYRPSDLQAQLDNTWVYTNLTNYTDATYPLELATLDDINALGNTSVYLTSKYYIDVNDNPSYTFGVTPNSYLQTAGAVSCAIIVNAHDDVHVDVFYMYFYAFDYGGKFVGHNLGNHVGDWEHNMIRFVNETPTEVWFSQHSNGEAFTYDAVRKAGNRPIVFSANGSHANYATAGIHDHSIPDLNLPAGLIEDFCDYGPIWDPTLSTYYYTYNASTNMFGTYDNSTPLGWLKFKGQWGDEQYPDSDRRQENFLGLDIEYRYDSGPNGPISKQLNRTSICPDNGILCIVRPFLEGWKLLKKQKQQEVLALLTGNKAMLHYRCMQKERDIIEATDMSNVTDVILSARQIMRDCGIA